MDESGATDYQYDAYGNLTQSTRTTRGIAYTTSYTYDDGDHLNRQQSPTLSETYPYTPASNQLTNLRTLTIGSTGPTTANRQLIYNDASRLYQLIEDGQLKATYLYSASGQRTKNTIHYPLPLRPPGPPHRRDR